MKKKSITPELDRIRLLADRILVKRDPELTKTAGGIIIPESSKEPKVRGKVIKAGKINELSILKPGVTVVFGKYGGQALELDGIEYHIFREPELFVALEDHEK